MSKVDPQNKGSNVLQSIQTTIKIINLTDNGTFKTVNVNMYLSTENRLKRCSPEVRRNNKKMK